MVAKVFVVYLREEISDFSLLVVVAVMDLDLLIIRGTQTRYLENVDRRFHIIVGKRWVVRKVDQISNHREKLVNHHNVSIFSELNQHSINHY